MDDTTARIDRYLEQLRELHPESGEILDALEAEFQSALILQMRESDALYAAVFDTAVDGILTIDDRGVILTMNQAAEQIFGVSAASMVGDNVSALMPEPDSSAHDGYIRAYLETGERKIIGIGREVQGRRATGELFPMDLAVSEVVLGKRRIFTGLVRDLTARRKTEAELEVLRRAHAQRERLAEVGAIAAKVVHDIGSPLAALALHAQLALRYARRGDADKVIEPIEQVGSEIDRLSQLSHVYMTFAREQRLEYAEVDVGRLVQRSIELWKPSAEDAGTSLRMDLPQEAIVGRMDVLKLRRVLDNLIKNAIEATHGVAKGEVQVELALGPDEGWVSIRVQDNGPGIEEGRDVFQIFSTTKPEGSGVGLAIARQLIHAHGGRIHHQPALPQGLVFVVELPV